MLQAFHMTISPYKDHCASERYFIYIIVFYTTVTNVLSIGSPRVYVVAAGEVKQ